MFFLFIPGFAWPFTNPSTRFRKRMSNCFRAWDPARKHSFFHIKDILKDDAQKSLRRTCDSRAYSPNDGKQESHLDVDSIGSLKLLLFLLTCSGCCCLTRCGFLTAFVSSGLALTTFATLLTLLPTCSEFQTKVSSNRSCNTCHRTLNFLQRIQISNLW